MERHEELELEVRALRERLPHQVWGAEGDGDIRPIRTVMSKIRRRLGDDPDNPTYIFTEPRVGYRMAKGERGRLAARTRATGSAHTP